MNRNFLIVAFLLVYCNCFSQSLDSTELKKNKFEIIQWLNSCHSISLKVLTEQDVDAKMVLIMTGQEWYNKSVRSIDNFEIIIGEDSSEENKETVKNVNSLLQVYQKVLFDPSFMRKQEAPLALAFAKEALILITFQLNE